MRSKAVYLQQQQQEQQQQQQELPVAPCNIQDVSFITRRGDTCTSVFCIILYPPIATRENVGDTRRPA
jgi:hypothetical protein